MDEELAYLLDLRLRLRGRPAAIAIVDRGIGLVARSSDASPEALALLRREMDDLRADLVRRFGPKAPVSWN